MEMAEEQPTTTTAMEAEQGQGQGQQGQGHPAAAGHAVVREAQAFLERLALSCENRAVPAEGERAEVRECVGSGRWRWCRFMHSLSHSHSVSHTYSHANAHPRYAQHVPSGGWAGPMTAAEISRLYRELLRLREDGPGAFYVCALPVCLYISYVHVYRYHMCRCVDDAGLLLHHHHHISAPFLPPPPPPLP